MAALAATEARVPDHEEKKREVQLSFRLGGDRNLVHGDPSTMGVKICTQHSQDSSEEAQAKVRLSVREGVGDFEVGTAVGTLKTILTAAVGSLNADVSVDVTPARAEPGNEESPRVIEVTASTRLPPKIQDIIGQMKDIGQQTVELVIGCLIPQLFCAEGNENLAEILRAALHLRLALSRKALKMVRTTIYNMGRRRRNTLAPMAMIGMLKKVVIDLNLQDISEILASLEDFMDNIPPAKPFVEVINVLAHVQGNTIAKLLEIPFRDGLKMPKSGHQVYEVFRTVLKGIESIKLDSGHGIATNIDFHSFDIFLALPPTKFEGWEVGNDTYGRFFALVGADDPVLRCIGSFPVFKRQARLIPKDLRAVDILERFTCATTTEDLIQEMRLLLELLQGDEVTLINPGNLMEVVKAKRTSVGADVWTKELAQSFGAVLSLSKTKWSNRNCQAPPYEQLQ